MICPKCGKEIQDNSVFCSYCGEKIVYQQCNYNYQTGYSGAWVKSTGYIVWAAISLLLFWPVGIPAIIYAAKIDTYNRIGNFFMADQVAKKSRTFSIVATCIGGFSVIMAIIAAIGLIFSGGFWYYYL